MKKTIKIFALLALSVAMVSCHKDTEIDPESIFDDNTVATVNEFDKWIQDNYVKPYNIDFKYRFEDKEADTKFNLVPAQIEKSIALAKLTKFLWLETYEELKGDAFIRTYCPKILHLIGSPGYQNGSMVLGTAEGGLKITLYNVNAIDLDHVDIEFLNYWFFKTMHHEFAHILHQKKNYSTDFNLISLDYQGGSWVNLSEQEALDMGFVSNYASSETQEDFVEIISIYATHDAAWWNNHLSKASAEGRDKINQKLEIVKDYLQSSWGINLDQLRDIVQRRSAMISGLDIKSLN